MISISKASILLVFSAVILLGESRLIGNRRHQYSLSVLKRDKTTDTTKPLQDQATTAATAQSPKQETSAKEITPRKKPFGRNKDVAVTDGEKVSSTTLTKALPSTRAASNCVDHPGWYDADGSTYNCDWYASEDTRCAAYGDSYENFGRTANEACCACKGCIHQDGFNSVADTPCGWYDDDGPEYDCLWYSLVPSRCQMYGDASANFGKTANQACSVCGGGIIL